MRRTFQVFDCKKQLNDSDRTLPVGTIGMSLANGSAMRSLSTRKSFSLIEKWICTEEKARLGSTKRDDRVHSERENMTLAYQVEAAKSWKMSAKQSIHLKKSFIRYPRIQDHVQSVVQSTQKRARKRSAKSPTAVFWVSEIRRPFKRLRLMLPVEMFRTFFFTVIGRFLWK